MIETTARRLADHPQFKWLRGALGLRWAPGHRDHLKPEYVSDGTPDSCPRVWGSVPDLNDAATIGTIEAQAREFCPGLILFPPENPGQMWAIGRDVLTCLAYAPSIGECWALAFLEVAGGQ